ncbi:MAG: malonyl-CoA synthase [Paracoccaceae bacterium]|nr:malonyl-CoA synthase [Paracoccaceae bacterium]
MTLNNPLFDSLFGHHDNKNTPFIHVYGDSTITHKEFLFLVGRMANAISSLGISTGDRLVLQAEKSPYCLAVYAACMQSGVIFLPLNNAYTANEVSYFVADSGAKIFICDPAYKKTLTNLKDEFGILLKTLDSNGQGTFGELTATMPNRFLTVNRHIKDLAAILYTSGTTGRSKGAMLTQENLLSNAKTLKDYWKFDDQDVLLHALPIFHTHGLFVASNVTLLAGGSMIFLNKFDLDEVVESLPRATTMMGVPTFYVRLLEDKRLTSEFTKHMRLFISGSAPLLSETHIRFLKLTGHHILERYGMTETNMNTSNPYYGERRSGTVGFPLPGVEIKITDSDTGKILSKNKVGQIEVRGPNVFKGYWGMEEKTKEELREDGFFITGDLGLIDSDGYIEIVGRDKDLIISGGYNIYPKEIELLLDLQVGVLESAVVGIPHPDFGETGVGFLVCKKGYDLEPGTVLESLSESLAAFKRPRKLIILDALPRNTMGKVQKNQLREQYKNLYSKP